MAGGIFFPARPTMEDDKLAPQSGGASLDAEGLRTRTTTYSRGSGPPVTTSMVPSPPSTSLSAGELSVSGFAETAALSHVAAAASTPSSSDARRSIPTEVLLRPQLVSLHAAAIRDFLEAVAKYHRHNARFGLPRADLDTFVSPTLLSSIKGWAEAQGIEIPEDPGDTLSGSGMGTGSGDARIQHRRSALDLLWDTALSSASDTHLTEFQLLTVLQAFAARAPSWAALSKDDVINIIKQELLWDFSAPCFSDALGSFYTTFYAIVRKHRLEERLVKGKSSEKLAVRVLCKLVQPDILRSLLEEKLDREGIKELKGFWKALATFEQSYEVIARDRRATPLSLNALRLCSALQPEPNSTVTSLNLQCVTVRFAPTAQAFNCLLDSGATRNFMSASVAASLTSTREHSVPLERHNVITGNPAKPLPVTAMVLVDTFMSAAGTKLQPLGPMTFYVVEGLEGEVYIGQATLRQVFGVDVHAQVTSRLLSAQYSPDSHQAQLSTLLSSGHSEQPQCVVPLAHTQLQCVVPSEHTQPQCVVPLEHTQPQSVVPLVHTQPQCVVPSEHTQPQCVVPLAHTQQQCVVPLAHTQQQSVVQLPSDTGNSLSVQCAQSSSSTSGPGPPTSTLTSTSTSTLDLNPSTTAPSPAAMRRSPAATPPVVESVPLHHITEPDALTLAPRPVMQDTRQHTLPDPDQVGTGVVGRVCHELELLLPKHPLAAVSGNLCSPSSGVPKHAQPVGAGDHSPVAAPTGLELNASLSVVHDPKSVTLAHRPEMAVGRSSTGRLPVCSHPFLHQAGGQQDASVMGGAVLKTAVHVTLSDETALKEVGLVCVLRSVCFGADRQGRVWHLKPDDGFILVLIAGVYSAVAQEGQFKVVRVPDHSRVGCGASLRVLGVWVLQSMSLVQRHWFKLLCFWHCMHLHGWLEGTDKNLLFGLLGTLVSQRGWEPCV